MKLFQRELAQLLIFAILFFGYQLIYRNMPINGVVNNIACFLIVLVPPILLFRSEKLLVSIPIIFASCALNVLVGLYILASVFRDGL